MSVEWTLVALLAVAVYVAASEAASRGTTADAALQRAERAERALAEVRRKERLAVAPWSQPSPPVAALPPAPEPAVALEVAGLAFSDPPVIDLPAAAAHTVEHRLVFPTPNPRRRMVNPMRPGDELFRPRWPGMKEASRVRVR